MTPIAETRPSPADLARGWADLRAATPELRIRDAAARLGVSEAELLVIRLGDGVVRLDDVWPQIIGALPGVGDVMALTRNKHCVHERHGTYGALGGNAHVGLIVGEDIDLRIFFSTWSFGFAVTEDTRVGPRHSLQFFDAQGTAVHKVYATGRTDSAVWRDLVARFMAPRQESVLAVLPAPASLPARPDRDIDQAVLRRDWAALQDTHDFFPLLRRHKVGREQALRLAGPEFAVPVGNAAMRTLLESAAADSLPIMVFVGNHGMIQIHTGPVRKLVATGPWFNVLDPAFNLHLREGGIASSWLVRKPTTDGTVTSLELFDHDGGLVVSFFGKRKPGQPELPAWRRLAESLVAAQAA